MYLDDQDYIASLEARIYNLECELEDAYNEIRKYEAMVEDLTGFRY